MAIQGRAMKKDIPGGLEGGPVSFPSFDPASLLARLRERHPLLPLIHIDRERTTGWSYVPVEITEVLEDGGRNGVVWGTEGSFGPSLEGWDRHPLLSRSLGDEEPSLPEYGNFGPPFTSGLVLVLPFETGELWEPSGGPFTGPSVPAFRCECREVVAFHAPTGRLFLPSGFDQDLLEPFRFPPPSPVFLTPSQDRARFSGQIASIRESLKQGDYFQLNLAVGFGATLAGEFDPLGYYSLLRSRMKGASSPGFGGFFSFRDRFVLSCSPEQLLSLADRQIRTFPIAGTVEGEIPGPVDPLLNDPKLLAEHIMIVDLLRNDIGRIARGGSVRVPRLLSIETYPHLRHLVSEIAGEVDGRFSRADVIKALFPGGSVTGAPKIRVRRHTQILEGEARNYYCGSLGFVSETGVMDLSLLIRTLEGRWTDFPRKREVQLTLKVGAGIVADSDTESEYREILLKARAFRRILAP